MATEMATMRMGNGASASSQPPPNRSRMSVSAAPQSSSSISNAIPLSARKSAGLDLSTVERRGNPKSASQTTDNEGSANAPVPPPKERPHGIQEAPTFRPTEEEFRNGPIDYISKIRSEGEKYGIVKIIPPEGWEPPFVVDSEKFHFRTRKQELNQTDGGTRANLNYLDNLARFHKQRTNTALNRFPSVDKRPLDLYKLKKFVEDKGGFDAVCRGKRWAEIGRDLGYSGKIMSSLSTSLKNSYQKWLQPYEDWLKEHKPAVLQAQQERENGTPYTPSPGPGPPSSHHNTPRPVSSAEPAIKATQALVAKLRDASPLSAPTPPPPVSGFTAVNAGGWTAVNASPSGFAAINAPNVSSSNGCHSPLQNGNSPAISSATPTLAAGTAPNDSSNALKRQSSTDAESLANGDDSGRKSKRAKKGDPSAPTVTGSQMMQPRLPAPMFVVPRDRSNDKPGDCDVCGKNDEAGSTLVCDSCDLTYHKQCLDKPAKTTAAAEGDWHCPRCLVGMQEYGFEEGGTYSLKQFQEKARNFKNRHFWKRATDPSTGDAIVSETDVEHEFWRLTESLTETVEVEYGADIHSTTHGSGFPTIERQPFNIYSTDIWNLNVMPLDKDSLFRHIKTDISGMTVPWLYVGMCFSTFCWHNEDHYTYSANYQHFGETKTWYGIPSGSSDRFEAAMRAAVPELFEQQPDLLFQLVTLLQPEKLKRAGVDVYALDQHAGEFVITFPQAYHAGFNHGFNFNEAVNFAPPDWEQYGADAVELLQEFKRQPVFSHDELLLSAATTFESLSAKSHCIKTAKWLAPALDRVMHREVEERETFLAAVSAIANKSITRMVENGKEAGPQTIPYVIDNKPLADEETVCAYCKCYGYLSRFVCKNSGKVFCLKHAPGYECCTLAPTERYTCSDGKHELQLALADQVLARIVSEVSCIANTPETWSTKLDRLLEDEARPSLKSLRAIVTEGEKIETSWHLPQLADLRDFVSRCSAWVDEASMYTARKPAGRRKSEMRSRGSVAEETKKKHDKGEEKKEALRNPDNVKNLLKQANELSFDSPEVEKLQERFDRIQEFRKKVVTTLKHPHLTEPELDELMEEGKDIDMDMPEMKSLEMQARTVRWFAEAKLNSEKMEQGTPLSLEELIGFVNRGKELNISDEDNFMRYFNEQKIQGEFWEGKAREIMAQEVVNFHQLDALYRQASKLAVSRGTLASIDGMLKKQREAQERIMTLYDRTKDSEIRNRPTYKEVRDTMEEMVEMNSKPPGSLDLEREQKRHEDWMRRGKKLFGKANAPLHILLQHMQIVQERNEACLDLRDQPRMPVEPASREQTPDEPSVDESHSSRDVFCICRRPESGMMIECELCHEWYHGRCLKIARGKVKEDDKYTCPICDYRVKIPRDAARPKLEELQIWQDEIATLPFQPEEEDVLGKIIDIAEKFRSAIAYLINPITTTPDDLSVQRFYLRKIEGADVLLAQETNFLRQEVHKWAPVAPEAPKLIEVSLSTRKPRPTKAQKLMNKMGVNSLDELPEHLRPKAPKNRKHPHPDGHRSGKGSMPANPSSNAKPGESITLPYSSHTPPGLPRGKEEQMTHSGAASTSTTSRAPSNPTDTPTFTFGGEISTRPNSASASAFAPPSPLFGSSTLGDPYISASAPDNPRNAYGTAGTGFTGAAGGPQSIDPQLENLFAHPSGMHGTASPEHDDLAVSANANRNSAELGANAESMDTLFAGLTNGSDEFEFTAGSYVDNEGAGEGERFS